jgi:hypothetical protein
MLEQSRKSLPFPAQILRRLYLVFIRQNADEFDSFRIFRQNITAGFVQFDEIAIFYFCHLLDAGNFEASLAVLAAADERAAGV